MSKLHMTAWLAVSVVALAACTKGDDNNSTDTNAEEESGDGDGDASSTKGSGEEAGDGDGDEPTTTGFVPDDGDIMGANTCDPWAQDCPEDEKCAAWAQSDTWDSSKCVPLMGTGKAGDECIYNGAVEGTDDCDVGFMCYYTNAEGIGSCVPLCTGSADEPMCPDNFGCSISNDGSLLLCLYSCDPLLQDCQQEGAGCFWDGAQFNCDPAGDILEGEPCGYINDCAPGHVCLETASLPTCAGSACCAGFCDLGEPQCQISGTECIAFFEEGTAPPGLENTGVCALPGT